MEYEKMLKELVHKIDRGYALANLIKNGVVPNTQNWPEDYINGVIGAYQTLEAKVHQLFKEAG